MTPRLRLLVLAPLAAALAAAAAHAAPDPAAARRVFAEAQMLCRRDDGRLWGRSLCGPMLISDPTDRRVLANRPDPAGALRPEGDLFAGVLPDTEGTANTPTEWSGARWTQLVAPVPADAAARHVLIAHELFHRIQPALGLTRPEAANRHLDTLEGRYLIQLEWRALARALQAPSASARRAGAADALAARGARLARFPDAAREESALDYAEGLAEYTGVRVGLESGGERRAYAVRDLGAFVDAPSFVRSFAYASGPAYGLLLDAAAPGWRGRLSSGPALEVLLAQALRLDPAEGPPVEAIARRYDPSGALRVKEEAREHARLERAAAYEARLVTGPVLVLPLRDMKYQFNPQTLVPLEGRGTVFPTVRLVDVWGVLEVEHGGALMQRPEQRLTVSAVGAAPSGLAGDGWKLTLNPGWRVAPGPRAGDLALVGPPG